MIAIMMKKKNFKSFIAMLERFARQGDGRRFQQLVEQIDWNTQSPTVLKRAIALSLSLELSRPAIDLAQKGRAIFPFDEGLQNAARVLRPPAVRVLDRAPSSVSSSMDWVNAHAAEYKNQWVAVRDGKLLASASSFKELVAQTTLDTDTLVTKVL